MGRFVLPYRTVLISLLLSFSIGCTVTSWKRTSTVVDQSKLVVETEQLYSYDSPTDGIFTDAMPVDSSFFHPAELNPETLTLFLSGIRYEIPSFLADMTYEPVFEQKIVPALALGVVKGLKRSGPGERIRFWVRNIRHKYGFVPQGRITRGVVFVQPEGILNIAFDLIDADPEEVHEESIYSVDWEDPTAHIASHEVLQLPEPASVFFDAEGERRPLWVVIPLEKLTFEAFQVGEEQGAPEGKEPDRHREPGTGAEAAPGEVKSTDDAETAEQQAGPEPDRKPQKLTDQEILNRLKYLKELRKKGMLTEEEYKKECEEIMKRF